MTLDQHQGADHTQQHSEQKRLSKGIANGLGPPCAIVLRDDGRQSEQYTEQADVGDDVDACAQAKACEFG